MRAAYFEEIRPPADDGNPYAAPTFSEYETVGEPEREPHLKRIRRLRRMLIALALAIVGLAVLLYVLYSSAKSSDSETTKRMLTILSFTCAVTASVLFLPLMVVVYRLARVLGHRRGMSIFYMILSTFAFGGGDGRTIIGGMTVNSWYFFFPIGTVIVAFLLCVHAQDAISDCTMNTDSV